ncbi:hypothetical protein Agabi119p4_2994 [Agaricus bisporus var. burnettii]|uniref:Ubiquitin fusion degradation protein 1 n=1 Tax=Agaricus bisporus var. burnettii TaxID=192524 RepID=A0A8H7F6G9_AGABI|nr:hypothetical protein Agabi119p4_2994 [Agaricus bisporus var. burnettii]
MNMDFIGGPNGPGGLLAQLAGGFPYGPGRTSRNPNSFDEYLKAYSVAMLPGRQRENVSYGGKVIMPPSALASLTNLEVEGPWTFQLRNPANSAASTHAGVLEFIAEEGVVHLPYWMMKTLRLNEGDPIRITGTELVKGKFVKLQAQTVHFLEISDPKAVLEQALRNFSALTQGDIIEISYNSIVFGLLVMETKPGGEGISILDTDLEVDFAAPIGYVEPERPKASALPTMASRLNIDLNSNSPGQTAMSKDGDHWESFKGKGETLGGRKTKGKGISHRKVEEVPEGSKIIRTDKTRIVNNAMLESEAKVPAALNLPFGHLFFGFNVAQYTPPSPPPGSPTLGSQSPPQTFSGSGQTLNGRTMDSSKASSSEKGKEKEPTKSYSWGSGGHALGSRNTAVGAGGASVPRPQNRSKRPVQKERSPTPDFGVDDDDDVIMISDDE